uniref:Thrombopoietin n=1 Tax=Mola mola TaxID=94237 RepID=A0A3Q3X245_MOLML
MDLRQAGLWHGQHVCPGLLLLCMVASVVLDAETKPTDFVCNKGARRAMNIVAEMKTALLACTELHVASWENKSHQEKRGDIVASLRLLTEGMKVMRVPGQPGCAASLLLRLENNISNYLHILTYLQLSVRRNPSHKLHANKRKRPSFSVFLLKGRLKSFHI